MVGHIIWWDTFCGNDSINNAFWSDDLTVNTPNPDLTTCFQNSVLLWIPCLFMVTGSSLYVPYVRSHHTGKPERKLSKLGISQLIGILLLMCFNYLDLYNQLFIARIPAVHLIASVCRITAFTAVLILHVTCSKRGVYNTGLAFFFWILTFIVASISLRSRLISQNYLEFSSTFYIQYTLILAEFLATFRPDVGYNYQQGGVKGDEGEQLLGDSSNDKNIQTKTYPEEICSFPEYLFCTWFMPILWKGYKHDLSWSDVWKCDRKATCAEIVPEFQRHWKRQVSKEEKKPKKHIVTPLETTSDSSADDSTDSGIGERDEKEKDGKEKEKGDDLKNGKGSMVAVALFKTLGRRFLAHSLLVNVVEKICEFSQPFLLKGLMNFVQSEEPHVWKGVAYAVGIFLSAVISGISGSHHGRLNGNTQLHIRTALCTAIYRKSLKLSTRAKSKRTEGEIVNLMSVDAEKVSHIPHFFHWFWISPVTFFVSLYLLWQYIGASCMLGIMYLFCVLPITSTYVSKKFIKVDKDISELKDERIKLTNQVLSGIKVLKLYGWEPHFQKKVNDIRQKQTDAQMRHSKIRAGNEILWLATPFLVAALCFGGYVLSSPDNVLTAETIFVSLTLLHIIRVPIFVIPHLITYGSECFVAAKRVSKYLQLEEIDEDSISHIRNGDSCITVKNATFTWGEKKRTLLSGINFDVKEGSLVAVVGEIGSGKSSLLSAILGEMIKLDGQVNVVGSKAYVPQQAWIQNMSFKNNILFGKETDKTKYEKVLKSCALDHDLSILPAGDMTEIGEKGINLSGGQKQRISLARAVYQDKDVYLFDDPLSAVDAHVGKHIFKQVIGPGGSLKHKTRVLVTNQIQYLPEVDEIIVMDDCEISERGSYEKLLELNGRFAQFIRTHENAEKNNDSEYSTDSDFCDESGSETSKLLEQAKSHEEKTEGLRKRMVRRSKSVTKQYTAEAVEKRQKENLVEEEEFKRGSLDLPTLRWYVTAVSYKFGLLALLCILLKGVLEMMSNVWLAWWSEDAIVMNEAESSNEANVKMRLAVYTCLGLAQAVGCAGFTILISNGSIKAGKTIHNALLKNVVKCPMSFFDTTPLGRIVNRFSKDIDSMDGQLPGSLRHMLHCIIPLVTSFLVISCNVPLFITVVIPLLLVFLLIKNIYTGCARQLQYMNSMKRSPVFSFFSETLNGAVSIRAYDCQERFLSNSEQLVDNSTSAELATRSANRWLGLNGQLLANCSVLCAALFVVLQRDHLSAAVVGLIISYAFDISGQLVGILHASCGLETSAVSIERLKEYAEKQTEAAWEIEETKPGEEWPAQGEIAFNNYSTRYREGLDLVLRNLSCTFKPEEKVGIVGRTGAGKSSMTMALFRIIEASSGSITIDGQDISQLGLHHIRRKLAIIPQDPVLFSGTIKFNLDPASQHTDEELWNVLELSHLATFVKSLPKTLEYECGEDGKNLSVGQRQLICLARALLRKTKILVLDEATASVDMDTDALIQATIRSKFKHCTVMTIAHRLNTILDYDKVMVMDSGSVLEFDSPSNLLKDKNSSFHSMAKDAGIV